MAAGVGWVRVSYDVVWSVCVVAENNNECKSLLSAPVPAAAASLSCDSNASALNSSVCVHYALSLSLALSVTFLQVTSTRNNPL